MADTRDFQTVGSGMDGVAESDAGAIAILENAVREASDSFMRQARVVEEKRAEVRSASRSIILATYRQVDLRYACEYKENIAKLAHSVEKASALTAEKRSLADAAEVNLDTARLAHGKELDRLSSELHSVIGSRIALGSHTTDKRVDAFERSLSDAMAKLERARKSAHRNPIIAFADRWSKPLPSSAGFSRSLLGAFARKATNVDFVRSAVVELSNLADRVESVVAAKLSADQALSEAQRHVKTAKRRASEAALASTRGEAELSVAIGLGDAVGTSTVQAFNTEMAVGNRAAIELALSSVENGGHLLARWVVASAELGAAMRELGVAREEDVEARSKLTAAHRARASETARIDDEARRVERVRSRSTLSAASIVTFGL